MIFQPVIMKKLSRWMKQYPLFHPLAYLGVEKVYGR